MEPTHQPTPEPTAKRPLTGSSIIDEPATVERCREDYAANPCARVEFDLAVHRSRP
ncbi:hypothetical protein AB0M28_13565 [Streptomyces sp. NPDC051940]|uniref:hypothetical protein n=1 Tax=Streptomyces sp. NPDC051940 TaxID=3155675 RepID=UPI003433F8A6